MNAIPTKPPLPDEECIGEVNKTLHLSRFKLLQCYDVGVLEELSNVFAKSSWRSEL